MDSIFDLRKKLHNNPEVSMHEEKTKQILMQFIRDNTKSVEVVDRNTWFYVFKRGTGDNKPVAFRSDYDAIRCEDGAARHLCGHDGHSAILAGLSLWIDKNDLARDTYLIFQPGEETGEGAKICSSLIEEKNIAEIYGFHNIPGYDCGDVVLPEETFACASTGLEIKITGSQSHAAYPENGVNPAVVIADILYGMNEFMHRDSRGIVLGTLIGIDAGGRSYGVSAGEATVRLTLRAEYQEEYDAFVAHIERLAKDKAAQIGAECSVTRIEEFPATINHIENIKKVEKTADNLKLRVVRPDEPFRWSEDFGYYLMKTKGAFFGIGCGKNHPGLHTTDYEFEDEIIETVIEIYKGLV